MRPRAAAGGPERFQAAGRIADGDQRAEDSPRRRRPLDQALVDVVAVRRGVVAPRPGSETPKDSDNDLLADGGRRVFIV